MKKHRLSRLRKLRKPRVRRQKPTFEIRRIPATRPERLDFEKFIDNLLEKG